MNSLENENFIQCYYYFVYISTTSFLHVQLAFLLEGDYVHYSMI